jgi:lysophospholipase L1-like esterase
MLECLILGDSIAVGTAQARPECVSLSKSGINSRDWNKKNSSNSLAARTVIISLGSNDTKNIRTMWELQQLRDRVQADRVFWIIPAIKPDVQHMVKIVANSYGDTVLPIMSLQKDGVHPDGKGYRALANSTKVKS